MDNITWGQQGWICPKCGSVWAPHVDGCQKCNSVITTVAIGDFPTNVSDPAITSTGSGWAYKGQDITISGYRNYTQEAADLAK